MKNFVFFFIFQDSIMEAVCIECFELVETEEMIGKRCFDCLYKRTLCAYADASADRPLKPQNPKTQN